MNNFLVLLDRDGTINVDKHYLADPDGLEILPHALAGMRALQDAGAVLCIVTNQSGIGRGYFDRATADAVNARLLEMLGPGGVHIHHVAVCPHGPDDGCDCRKPAPGLAEQCAKATGLPLADHWVIGDKPSDVGLATATGGRGILIGPADAADCGQAASVPHLVAAAEFILSARARPT